MKNIIFAVLTILSALVITSFGQVIIAPFDVDETDTIAELKAIKAAKPKMTVEEFAQAANELIAQKGIGFEVGFDENTCQKILQIKNSRQNDEPLRVSGKLNSPIGQSGNLRLPAVHFRADSYFSCEMKLPVVEITEKNFVIVLQGKNLQFNLPNNFRFHRVEAVDAKDLLTVKKRWQIPFSTAPISISGDGNILYLGFTDQDLSDLTLLAFAEGVYQFAPKSTIDTAVKAALLNNPNATEFAFKKFEKGSNVNVVRFSKKYI